MTQVFRADRVMSDAEQDAALRQYADALKSFTVEALCAGWTAVRDDYKGKTWPAIGLLTGACRTAQKARNEQKPKPNNYSVEWITWQGVKASPLALRAAKEGGRGASRWRSWTIKSPPDRSIHPRCFWRCTRPTSSEEELKAKPIRTRMEEDALKIRKLMKTRELETRGRDRAGTRALPGTDYPEQFR
jgi:hypothetical protein